MSVQVTLFDSATRERWLNALEEFDPQADVYFGPDYLAACEANGDGNATGLLVTADERCLYVPYLCCPIANSDGLFDVQGAYGYGGPLLRNCTTAFIETAWRTIEALWQGQGVVAAFLRLHPLINTTDHLGPRWTIVADRPTISVDLHHGIGAAFGGAAGANHRNMVSRARRLGMSWRCHQATVEQVERFVVMYEHTMTRLQASQHYYFSAPYYAALAAGLGDRLSIAEVVDAQGQSVCMALVMWGTQWAHYHLSARLGDAEGCATNLLLQGTAEIAADRGLCALHLGGGRTPDRTDSLLRFKQRVGQSRHQFNTARLVVDPLRYETLVRAWRTEHAGATPSWFLGYRQP